MNECNLHSRNVYFLILITILWHISIIFSNYYNIPASLGKIIYFSKLVLPFGLIVLVTIKQIEGSLKVSQTFKIILSGALFFPLSILIGALINDNILMLSVSYNLYWWCVVFISIPLLITTEKTLKIIIQYNLIVGALFTLICVIIGYQQGFLGNRYNMFTGETRLAPGFMNPNFYSAELSNIFIFSIILAKQSTETYKKYFYWAIPLISITGIVAANSRSSLVFLVVFSISYIILTLKIRHKILLITTVLILLIYIATEYNYLINTDMNTLSSGRLSIWTVYIDQFNNTSFSNFLFGDVTNHLGMRTSYNPLQNQGILQKQQSYTDNTYLNWIINFGVIGTISLFIPFIHLVIKPFFFITRRSNHILTTIGLSCTIAFFTKALFVTTIPALTNPVSFLVTILILPTLFIANNNAPHYKEP